MATPSKTVDVTLPSDREVRVSRVFNAPARLVFDFHTKPDLLKRWLLGPPGWHMPVCEIDLRVGGRCRYRWRSDDGRNEFGSTGEYREVVAPSRIVHTEVMEGIPTATPDDPSGAAIITMTLVEKAGKTTLTTTMLFPTKEIRDQAVATGMTDGMGQSYDRMEEILRETVG